MPVISNLQIVVKKQNFQQYVNYVHPNNENGVYNLETLQSER